MTEFDPFHDCPQVEIMIPSNEFMNSNDRRHHMESTERTRRLRQRARLLARSNSVTSQTGPVQIYARIANSTNNKFDPANAYPTIKAILDGFTDAKVWPDDDSRHITSVHLSRDPRSSPRRFYRATIIIVPENHPSYTPF